MTLAARAALALVLLSSPALAIPDTEPPAVAPAPAISTAPPDAPPPSAHPCGHMTIRPDGTFTPPPEVAADALDSARTAIMLFPLGPILQKFQDKMGGDVDTRLAASTDSKEHDALMKLKRDLPRVYVIIKTDVIDLVASGIACHQTKPDLDALSAFIQTSAGQKLLAAAAEQQSQAPPLTADETKAAYAYMTSDAGKRAFAEFHDGSDTDNWMKAEMPLVAMQIVAWLKTTYGLDNFGAAL